MAVIQVKKYKTIKDENGNKIQVPKTKEEWNRETCNGEKTWYFVDRYELNGKKILYKSFKFALRREAEEHNRLFINDPIDYITKYSKKAKKHLEKSVTKDKKTLDDYYDDFFNKWDLKYNKESTAYDHKNNYFKHVSPILGQDIPENINIERIDYFHEEIDKKNLKQATKVNINSVLSKLLDYLITQGKIKINYAKVYGSFKKTNDEITPIEKEIKYQTLEQFNIFIKEINDIFWISFYTFLFWHGLRKGEQQALTWKDIDFEKMTVTITKTVAKNKNGGTKLTNTKNKKNRIIYLAKQSLESLNKWYNIISKIEGFSDTWYVFGNENWIARNTIDRRLLNDYKKIMINNPNINILTHHEFGRHSHASYLLDTGLKKGINREKLIAIIAQRLGDTPEVIKNTYIHAYENEYIAESKELFI